ncbi:MAG: hypothetical protein V2A56_08555 [bacterium]
MTAITKSSQPVSVLLTHTHPDLDAILSIHLMRLHGTVRYPGADTAELRFTSANTLPGGKTSEQLEEEGILTLDTGGGRYDNHPVDGQDNREKWDTCASMIVAEELGVANDERYRFLLPYALNHDARGQSLSSKEAAHHLLAPHGLIEGLHGQELDDAEVVERTARLLEGIAQASVGTEAPRQEVAGLFDRTLHRFLCEGISDEGIHQRKEEMGWPAEGESHIYARQKRWHLRRDLEKLLKIASWLLAGHENAEPDDEGERSVILPRALIGLVKIHGGENDAFYADVATLLKAAMQREADWFSAIDEVERSAKVIRGRGVSMVAIASKNGLTIKAARYRRGASAVLYYEPRSNYVTLQAGQRKDGKPILNLQRIAVRLRGTEVIKRHGNGAKPPKNANGIGMVEGWFLHPSLKLLICGSPKAPDARTSALSWQEIIEIVTTDLRPEEKMPEWFCPEDRCLDARCTLFPLRLANCHAHRQNTREAPKPGTLGELFADKLKNRPPARGKSR